jgi:endonuclease-3
VVIPRERNGEFNFNFKIRRKEAFLKKVRKSKAPKKSAPRKTPLPVGQKGLRREPKDAKRARTKEIIARLKREYPEAKCSLNYENAYQLLVATILSAQCTDERVNQVTPALFKRYPAAADLAGAKTEELSELIKSTGFFNNKTRNLLGMSNGLVERHGAVVPDEMDALVELPGVGRKTANVVLGNAFGKAEGVVVDTHVSRLSGRLGLSAQTDAVKIEEDLIALVDRSDWTILAHLFIDHGRAVCKAPKPLCEVCVLNDICPSSRV